MPTYKYAEPTAPSNDAAIVPFGKYRGLPIETLLADEKYLEWITTQPGIMDMLQSKHPAVFNIITIGTPATTDTPEHNKLSSYFLDEPFQHAFIKKITGNNIQYESKILADKVDKETLKRVEESKLAVQKDIENATESLQQSWVSIGSCHESRIKKKMDDCNKTQQSLTDWNLVPAVINLPQIQVIYECGFDIHMCVLWTVESCEFLHLDIDPGLYRSINQWTTKCIEKHKEAQYKIELKPTLGDDFPGVPRQMNRNESDTLVIGSFNARGCTLEQVRKIFATNKIKIVTLAEIQAIMNRTAELQ